MAPQLFAQKRVFAINKKCKLYFISFYFNLEFNYVILHLSLKYILDSNFISFVTKQNIVVVELQKKKVIINKKWSDCTLGYFFE